MAQSWYYEIVYVGFHQDKPSDWPNIGGPPPRVYIGQYETALGKYSLHPSFRTESGEPDSSFDFTEYDIGWVTTSRPADFHTAMIAYQREDLDGGMQTAYRQKWGVITIYEDATIPDEFRINVADYVVDATIDGLKSYADNRGFSTLRSLLDQSEQIIAARSLYEVIRDHMDDQFTLLDKALDGEISPHELIAGSELAARGFTDDLIDEAGLPPETAQLVDLAYRVHEYTGLGFSGIDGQIETFELRSLVPDGYGNGVTYQGGGIDEVFLGSRLSDQVVMGSQNDTVYGRQGNDYIDGGAGDDVLIGGQGYNTLVGGQGFDTAVYANNLSDYSINSIAGSTYVVSRASNIYYSNDRLSQIDRYSFGDGVIVETDASPLVSSLFYFSNNLDVWNLNRSADMPDQHFSSSGWREGRDPNPLFSTLGYLGANPDIRQAGINPLDHFSVAGWREGRDPSSQFDVQLYLLNNPDVAAAGLNPLSHYLSSGASEGRGIAEAIGQRIDGDSFDREFYLLANPDVAAAGLDARHHYETQGWREGRDPNAFFDTDMYLLFYADVKAAQMNPLDHYNSSGWREGRDTFDGFSSADYLQAYGDVAGTGVNPLYHYLQFGIWEGRQSFAGDVIIA